MVKNVDYGIYVDTNFSSNSDMLLKINDKGIEFLREKLINAKLPKQGASGVSGNVGRIIEQLVVQYFHPHCHNIGANKGPDLLVYCLDIKSHKETHANSGSVNDSAWTIGSMSSLDILFTDYEDTDIHAKLQGHIEVGYDDEESVITSVNVYYYDNKIYQERFKKAYEEARKILFDQFYKKNPYNITVPEDFFKTTYPSYSTVKIPSGVRYGYFEKGEKSGFNFRLPHSGKKKLNKTANSTFIKFFEEN